MLIYGSVSVPKLVWMRKKEMLKFLPFITCVEISSECFVPRELFLFVWLKHGVNIAFPMFSCWCAHTQEFFGCRCRMRRPSLSMYVKLFGALNLGILPSSAVQQVLQHQCDSWGSSCRCQGSHFKVDFIHCPSTGRAQQRSTFPPLFVVDLHFP